MTPIDHPVTADKLTGLLLDSHHLTRECGGLPVSLLKGGLGSGVKGASHAPIAHANGAVPPASGRCDGDNRR